MLPDHDASRAVLIGAHSYSHLGDLRGVEGNVRDLKRFLTSPGGWRLPEQHCLDRLQPAGRDELLEELYRAAEEAEDTLLIYYAGHGLNDPASAEKLHLAMPASHPDRPFTWISYDDIRQAVFQSRAVRKLVVLDCCYGGRAIAGGMSGTSGERQAPAAPLDTVAEAGMTEREGVAVLTAASEEEKAWCPPRGEYSAFTGPLLQLLHHGITGPFPGQANGTRGEHREWIDLGTAHAYLQAQLRGKRTDGGRPLAEPQLGSRNSGWGIVLARNVAYTGAVPSPGPGSPGPAPDDIEELRKRAAGKAAVGRETPQNPPAARPRDDMAVQEQFRNDQGGGDGKAERSDAPKKPGSLGTRLRSRPILVATTFLCGTLTGALAFFIPTHRSVAGDADIHSSRGSPTHRSVAGDADIYSSRDYCKVSKLACLYTDDNFEGGAIGLKSGQEVKSLGTYDLNDQISSWRNYTGVTCHWYVDEDFKGKRYPMTGPKGVNLKKSHPPEDNTPTGPTGVNLKESDPPEDNEPSSVRCDSK